MKNRLIKKALCVALASTMVFGEALPAMAADGSADVQSAQAEVACAEEASITYFSVGGQDTVSSGSVHISAAGYGTEAVLYVNGAWYDSWTGSDYDGSWHVDTEFRGVAGATYQFKLVVSDDNGQTVSQESGKIYFEAPKFSRSRKPSEYVSYSTGDTGYRELGGVSVSFPFDSYVQNDIWYEVYRSTKPSGGFTRILSGVGYMYGASEVRYYDNNVKVGNTYYYMAKIVTGTDSYNKTSRVVETSAVAKVDCRLGTAELSVDRGAKGADITVSDYGAANQFDLYRSTSKTKGFKKIKTIYTPEYTDTTVKAGKTYYYKVVPKYYDASTRAVSKGTASEVRGVKILMGTTELTAV